MDIDPARKLCRSAEDWPDDLVEAYNDAIARGPRRQERLVATLLRMPATNAQVEQASVKLTSEAGEPSPWRTPATSLPISTGAPSLSRPPGPEKRLARLDKRLAKNPIREGWVARTHFLHTTTLGAGSERWPTRLSAKRERDVEIARTV